MLNQLLDTRNQVDKSYSNLDLLHALGLRKYLVDMDFMSQMLDPLDRNNQLDKDHNNPLQGYMDTLRAHLKYRKILEHKKVMQLLNLRYHMFHRQLQQDKSSSQIMMS